MKILFKFIITNIKEKKFRTFTILISIILSTALFFTSGAVSKTFTKLFLEQTKGVYGNASIVVVPTEKSPALLFSKDIIPKDPRIKDKIGIIFEEGIYKPKKQKVWSEVISVDFNKLSKIDKIELLSGKNLSSLKGNAAIVSQKNAKKYNLKLNDKINVMLNNKPLKLRIKGIAKDCPFFNSEKGSIMLLTPKASIEKFMNVKNKNTAVLLTTKENVNTKKLISKLSKSIKNYEVKEAVNGASIDQELLSIQTPFLVISILVLIMSVFIIYSCYKVIMVERLPLIGTFRSVGATKKSTRIVLLLESLFYGTAGSVIGIPVGIIVLNFVTKILSGNFVSTNAQGSPVFMTASNVSIVFGTDDIIKTLLLGIVISFSSAYIPIFKSSRLPLKEVVLGNIESKQANIKLKTFIGTILGIFSVIAAFIVPWNMVMTVSSISIAVIIISILLLITFIMKLLLPLFEKIYSIIFGNDGALSIKNMRDNANINQSIGLLIIIVATSLLIPIINNMVVDSVLTSVNSINEDNYVQGTYLNHSFITDIKKIKEIKNTYYTYETKIEAAGSDNSLEQVDGVDYKGSLDFLNIHFEYNKDPKVMLKLLQNKRNIILNRSDANSIGLKAGDTIKLKTPNGNKKYKIIGIMIGSYCNALVGRDILKKDFNMTAYGWVGIKSSNPNLVARKIRNLEKYKNSLTENTTKSKMRNRFVNMFNNIFGVLKAFTIILMLVGSLGMLSNLMINFLQRKRVIAMYKSIGMSKNQLIKTMLLEALTMSIIGSIIGTTIALLQSQICVKLMEIVQGDVNTTYSPVSFVIVILISTAIIMVGVIAPLIKGNNLKIIEAIKYE